VTEADSPADRDPVALAEALTGYVQTTIAGSRAAATDVRRVSEGWETIIYAFTLADEDAGQREELVLRAYPGQYATHKAQAEYQVISALARAGYPVPRLFALELDPSTLGSPFILMERLDGMPVSETAYRSPISECRRLIDEFSGLAWQLHSFDWQALADQAPAVRKPWTPSDLTDLAGYNRRWLTGIREFFGQRGLAGLDPALDWLLERIDDAGDARLALVHGDYHMRNVLLTGAGRQVVIDWTNAEIADCRYDLAWTLLLQGMYDGWAVRESILAAYEERLGHAVEWLHLFEAWVCIRRLLSMLVSLTQGAESFGMRAGSAEIMRKQIWHMECVYMLLCARTGLTCPETEALLERVRSG